MKKTARILSMLLTCCMVLGMIPLTETNVDAHGETDIAYAVEGGNIYFDAATGTITRCDYDITSADIPSEINGVRVTAIGEYAFYGFRMGCLTSVTIPDSVVSIGESAFWDCDITSITIPSSVVSIAGSAFDECSSLSSIVADTGNSYYTSVNGILFDKTCSSLIKYPSAKGSGTSYTIPDSVTSIGDCAFSGCSLASVTIPDSVVSIGKAAFAHSNLTSIIIPDGITIIENGMFSECYSLTSVTIPDGVTRIGDFAFYECAGLTSIRIPDSVTSIGECAFNSSGLMCITVPDSVATIGDNAFVYCRDLADVYYGGSEADWKIVSVGENNTCLTKATIHYKSNGTGSDSNTTVPTPAVSGFSDVQPTAYYFDSVKWAVIQGITTGTSATKFSPERTCTRAQILTFLWRAAGSPEPKGTVSFSDVGSKAYYAKAAVWAAEQGIVTGNTFAADTPCTRLEAVEYMWKYDGSPSSPNAGFTDVKSPAVDWAVNEGVTNGTGATTFSPEQTCTRAQIVTFLYRAFA